MKKLDYKLIKALKNILQKRGIKKAGIFGSYARGEQKKNSDIDVLVEFDGSLLDLIELELELNKVVKKKIDLLTYESIHPLLKNTILNEERRII